MVRYKPLRVNSETIDQIDQLTAVKGCTARELLQTAVANAWLEEIASESNAGGEAGIVLVDGPPPLVQPKTEYRDYVETIIGGEAPYEVLRTADSWAGHSEGVYQIKGCPVPVPVSWFDSAAARNKQPLVATTPLFFAGWVVIQVVLQIIFFALIL
jgi:hypothetical protein